MSTPDRLTDEEPRQRQTFTVEVDSPAKMPPAHVGLITDALRGRLSVSTDREVSVAAAQPPATDRDALGRAADEIAAERVRMHESGVGQPRQMGLVDAERIVRALAARPAPDALADRVQALRDETAARADLFLRTARHHEARGHEAEAYRDASLAEAWAGVVADLRALLAGRSDASPEGGA